MRYVEVAVNSTVPHRRTFSYSVPEGMEVQVGQALYVPFGRRTLQGVVMEVAEEPGFPETRDVLAPIHERPIVSPAHVALARWIADYYLTPVFDAVSLMLPPGFERKPLTILRPLVSAQEVAALDLPPRQREVLEGALASGRVEMEELRKRLRARSISLTVQQLERRGFLAREYQLARPRVGPKSVTMARLAVSPQEARARMETMSGGRTSRRANLLERLAGEGTLPVRDALKVVGDRRGIDRLVTAGYLRLDREQEVVGLRVAAERAVREARTLRQTRAERTAAAALAELAARDEPLPLPALRSRTGIAAEGLQALAGEGLIALEERPVERDPLADHYYAQREPPELLPSQEDVYKEIEAALENGSGERAFLLHGVTGSGKTEVYLRALARAVALGRRGIVLVPEIALTPQTVRRFAERFPGQVAVLHSGLSQGELFDQWWGIREGRYAVVIGSRSALFAPQPDLGLIIIDEEHEWTYKQHDQSPRYHAREAAEMLAQLSGAVLLAGSATPDLVTYHRARAGRWRLLTLRERVRPVVGEDGSVTLSTSEGLPMVQVVDLREELKRGNRSIFSRALRQGVESALAAGEQVILFLNRRGAASFAQCRDCGYVPQCSSCAVALTYHRQFDALLCHQCNRRRRLPEVCPECGGSRIRLLGTGVEKVEEEAARAFFGVRLLRWDRDVTRGRGAHERILSRFLAGEADILIGTQMLAKGLDLPQVTLVGVISADVSLHLPDYRAGERTFQLMTQVAGRAGRGTAPGRVIIQTYTPDHYAISAAARHDYEGFYAEEISSRRQCGYPPFSRLVRLMFAHTGAAYAREEAERLVRILYQERDARGIPDLDILGPTPAYVARVRGRYRWQIVLRGREPAELLRDMRLPQNWIVDVDPVTLT